ncbi:MAG TPA: bifunctional oligoribonuclease/PAP phosphatase NrnA [Armatimonadaceae bacterium]|nr:bifunctional oligoribonuclease/PAP phosphatase NrnA [Armatimonadaceae bacterium]
MVAPLEREQMGEAVAAIRAARNIVIACHVNPDGDTLGCMLALGLGLEQMGAGGKAVTLLSSDGVPDLYTFLPGSERIQRATDRRDFDLSVVVDAGDLSRIGAANRETVEAAPILIDIDHHVTSGQFGQIRLLDATAAATAEILYDLLLALGVEITRPIAENLQCALLTDTGSFRFMNVTPRTFALAGALMEKGASPAPIAERVFENKSYAAQKLLGRALGSLRRSEDGRIVWAHVTRADFQEFAATDEDTEGVVNAVRSVRGADVALFLREMGDGRLRVSLRSRDPIDVSQVAAAFGGGGHRLASGCTLDGPLADAEATLVAEVARRIDHGDA